MSGMVLTPEQIRKLISAVPTKKRAAMAGIPAKAIDNQTARTMDANNTAIQKHSSPVDRLVAQQAERLRGFISLPGAPRSLEDSGLAAAGFQFDESQLKAIHKLVHGRHVTLIGAAGTGKTTMIRHAMAQLIYGSEEVEKPLGIRQLGGDQGPSIALVAFTGIATQVMMNTLPAWLRGACKTFHGLLEYKPADEDGKMFIPTRNRRNKLDHDLIVIDESSMVGLELWHNLVNALRPHTRIIMLGDLNQLKPVADATMFAYALAAGLAEEQGWSLAELTTIHRQKEPAANKIIDASQAILNGRRPVFDNPADPDWRVIGYELPIQAGAAHAKIVGAVDWLCKATIPGEGERPIFDPYQDLLLTAGNGENDMDSASLVQQVPLNQALSRIIEVPSDEHPLYIIDAGRETKRFAVGHRVMATKNESPDRKDRVTNGQTGRIVAITANEAWKGNRAFFGTEAEVLEFRRKQADAILGKAEEVKAAEDHANEALGFSLATFDTSKLSAKSLDEAKADRQASHKVTVRYGNGAERGYTSAADVMGIQLAYAMTVHKAQGSQADTVIVVVHQAVKGQLSREWFYTAVTRAKRRLVVLYTERGLATAFSKQQIFGASLLEKVQRYKEVMASGRQSIRLTAYTAMDYDPEENYESESECENDEAAE